MKKFLSVRFVLLAALAVSGAALAINQWEVVGQFIGGIEVHPRSIAFSSSHKVTRMLGGSLVYDFASSTIECDDSTAITVTGAQVGDACSVGSPATGGADNSVFSCYVSAAGAVKIRHCPVGTASDPADAGFYVRIISSQ